VGTCLPSRAKCVHAACRTPGSRNTTGQSCACCPFLDARHQDSYSVPPALTPQPESFKYGMCFEANTGDPMVQQYTKREGVLIMIHSIIYVQRVKVCLAAQQLCHSTRCAGLGAK
jgi:hypothetical protein